MKKLFINGNIITMNKEMPKIEAICVKDGVIIKVGSTMDMLKVSDKNTKIIDLKDKTVVPGFIDSHLHLLNFGYSMTMIDVSKTKSIVEIQKVIKKYIKDNNIPKGTWIRARGWNQDYIKEKRYPTKEELDQITEEYQLCLTRICGHVAIVNSRALKIINIRESEFSKGIFCEEDLSLVYKNIPEPSIEDIKNMIVSASNYALSRGITSVHTDDFLALPGGDYKKVIQAYTELEQENKLPIKIYEQCLFSTYGDFENFLKEGYKTGWGSDYFKIGPLKLLQDGSLGARTAYLNQPYSDENTTNGVAVYTKEALTKYFETANKYSMQIAVHCIGDKAMDMVLEVFEKTTKYNNNKNRNGIVHCQITNEGILEKFKKQNIIAYIQPIFLHYDLHIVEKRIGTDKAKVAYNWRTMVDMGIHTPCSSDCPVESLDVLPNIYCGITRKDLNGYPDKGWFPEQKLSIEQALYGFTMEGAYASFEENIKGSIEVGKVADFVILSEDITTIEVDEVKNIKVLDTYINGENKRTVNINHVK